MCDREADRSSGFSDSIRSVQIGKAISRSKRTSKISSAANDTE